MSARCRALVLAAVVPVLASCDPERSIAPRAIPRAPNSITNGVADVANIYSNVGSIIVQAPDGSIIPFCSGTLIAPTVLLTAGHCTVVFEGLPATFNLYVTFRNVVAYGDEVDAATIASLIEVTDVITNPALNQRQSNPGDLGILILAEAPTGITPATLPTLGLLDELAAQNGLKGADFTIVGYGVQEFVVGGGPPSFFDTNPVFRRFAVGSFMSLNKGYLRIAQNPATGDGGACYGDSGGPNFLSVEGELVLVAVTVTGDAVCRATNVVYRLDTPSAQTFLAPYIP